MLEFNCQSLSLLVSAFLSAKGLYIDLLPTGGGGGVGGGERSSKKNKGIKFYSLWGLKIVMDTSCITVHKML